ncbi:hypothetical protein SAMN05421736_101420 [Evansella caseinilytica]|uniref:Uncharacterized protein n=1 Tax=Evansella caseinilytica TaxID=1503961 RepID=A0A1H3H8P7_9BACI|nr:hypothetical protein SAMN05421736_101420 [Evansella caseinilytica]
MMNRNSLNTASRDGDGAECCRQNQESEVRNVGRDSAHYFESDWDKGDGYAF